MGLLVLNFGATGTASGPAKWCKARNAAERRTAVPPTDMTNQPLQSILTSHRLHAGIGFAIVCLVSCLALTPVCVPLMDRASCHIDFV